MSHHGAEYSYLQSTYEKLIEIHVYANNRTVMANKTSGQSSEKKKKNIADEV